MTNNKELLLVYASMHNVRLEHTVNIMLTPQFYTLKKESLPVKYAYQAKKIAPSLFDGLLDENGSHEYMVFKEEIGEESKWVFIAYDIDKIVDFLHKKGIDTQMVSKIFFAQQSLEDFSRAPLALNDSEALTVINDTVVTIPRQALGENNLPTLRFTNSFTPKTSGIKIKSDASQASSLLGKSQAFSIAAIFLLFAGMFAVEGSRYTGQSQEQIDEIASIYTSYPYLKSSYTRDDAIAKYKILDKQERKKRDGIKRYSSLIFKGVTMESLHVDDKSLQGEFSCSDSSVASKLKDLANKPKDNFFKVKGDTTITMEARL